MAAPRLTKVTVSVATGSAMKKDRKRNDIVLDRLMKITGQKATLRKAKMSVASFKTREGDQIGVAVTLRGARMFGFLDKVFNVALPRTKDFRGLNRTSVDNIGNMTFGIKEHTIFPEIKDEELKDIFGMAVTLVTTAKTKEEATKFFELIGIPFKKA
jgi:large subunit ribosomal protein L5